jgi:hypothetical protein
VSLQTYDEHTALCQLVQIEDSDGTTPKYITQGPGTGCRVDALILTSSSAAGADVGFYLNNGSNVPIGTVAVPAGAGLSGAVPAVDAIPILAPVLAGLVLAPGTSLYVGVAVALGAGEVVSVSALGGIF